MTTTLTGTGGLLQPLTQQQAFQLLLTYYQLAGYPTTAWEQGGPDIARNQAFSTGLTDLVTNYIPAIAGGSLLDYAPNYPGWMPLFAKQVFNLDANPATSTQGYILATNSSSNAYSFSPSSPLTAIFGVSGKRYFSVGSGTIPASGSLSILFQAEFAGAAYADPSNSAGLTLATSLPGVVLTNPSSNYSTVTRVGSGTGTVVPSGSPVGPHSLSITITSTGQTGVATWSYSLDGAAAVNAGAVSSLTNIGGTGINVTLANGSLNPSFALNDVYSFSTPAPWITSQGADAETDLALAQRCRARWATQSAVPTQSLYQFLATTTPTVGSQVTQVFVVADSVINNKINIIVSGPGGVLPQTTLDALQAYITPRARGCDNPIVQSPTTLAIAIGGTVTVSVGQFAAAQNAITAALQTYIAGIPVNGTIRLSTIIELIMLVSGVINVDVSSVTLNGVANNLPLGGVGSYVLPAYPPAINLAYVTQ